MSVQQQQNWLLELAGYDAGEIVTPSTRRGRLRRAGLAHADGRLYSRADVRRAQWAAWRAWRAEHPQHPTWLAARIWEGDRADWQSHYPRRASVGDVVTSSTLAHAALATVRVRPPYARVRKIGTGEAGTVAAVTTTTNGKTGWNLVVDRSVDYGSVLSPDGRWWAVRLASYDSWRILRTVPRGDSAGRSAMLDGCRISCGTVTRYRPTIRDRIEAARRAGLDARVVRQTDTMVGAGSSESLRRGGVVEGIVADGLGGWYHVLRTDTVHNIRQAIALRVADARDREREAALRARAAQVWVDVAASLRAGNCLPGTEARGRDVLTRLGWDCAPDAVAIRGDVLLEVGGDDVYARRALRAAAVEL